MWWETPKKDDYVEEAETSNDVIIYSNAGKPKGIEIIGLFPNELNLAKQLGKKNLVKHLKSPLQLFSSE